MKQILGNPSWRQIKANSHICVDVPWVPRQTELPHHCKDLCCSQPFCNGWASFGLLSCFNRRSRQELAPFPFTEYCFNLILELFWYLNHHFTAGTDRDTTLGQDTTFVFWIWTPYISISSQDVWKFDTSHSIFASTFLSLLFTSWSEKSSSSCVEDWSSRVTPKLSKSTLVLLSRRA